MSTKPVGVWKVPVIDLKATGRNITSLRKKSGLSVRDLQTLIGFTNPQAIYKWQSGTSLPSIDNLVVLAVVFGVSIDEILVYDSDDPDIDDMDNEDQFLEMTA